MNNRVFRSPNKTKKLIQTKLLHFYSLNHILEKNLFFFIPMVLHLYEEEFDKTGMYKTRLGKLAVSCHCKYSFFKDNRVLFYRYGPIIQDFYYALGYLQNEGILTVKSINNSEKILLTSFGKKKVKKWMGINKFDSLPYYNDFTNLLSLPLKKLIKISYQAFSANARVFCRNKFLLIRIFDWHNYGVQDWQLYHDTILSLLFHLKKTQKINILNEQIEYFNSSKIVDEITINSLIKKDNHFNTFDDILDKRIPSTISEDKVEAKNYIFNRWFLLEAVNMFHIVLNAMPTIKNIAEIGLLSYFDEINKLDKKSDFSSYEKENYLKIWIESHLRRDVHFLMSQNFLNTIKIGKIYCYYLTSKSFYDENLKKYYFLQSENEILKREKDFQVNFRY